MSDCWNVLGVCIEKRIDLGSAALVLLGLAGLLGVYYAYLQLKVGQRSTQTQVTVQLYRELLCRSRVARLLVPARLFQGTASLEIQS